MTLDVDRYYHLPRDLWVRVNEWLKAEGLIDKGLIWFRLLEGAIEGEHYVYDDAHRVVVDDGKAQTTRTIFRIATPPPKEALS